MSVTEAAAIIEGLERHIATIRGPAKFEDAGPFEAGEVKVRPQAGGVALAVTRRGRGWAGVVLDSRAVENLIKAIKAALRG